MSKGEIMKNYCKVVFMCMQVSVLFSSHLDPKKLKDTRRRSPVRPPEKTQTTSERPVPIPLTKSGEMIINSQPKSPSQAISPGDYIGWFDDQGRSPGFLD